MKSIIFRIFVVLFGCLIAFLIGEAVLRGLGYAASDIYTPDPSGLLVLNPNEKIYINGGCFQNTVETNSLGFHSKEYPVEKAEGIFRIVIIGDSFTEAAQVPLEKTIAALLEKKLNSWDNRSYKYEVIPFGISSHGTFRNILYFQNYASRFKPDLVIDALAWNDIEDDAGEPGVSPEPKSFKKSVKKVFRKSVLITTLRRSYYVLKSNPEKDKDTLSLNVQILLPEYDDFWQKAWVLQEKLLKDFKETAAVNGADFMVVSLTDGYRVHPDLLERFRATAKDRDIDLEKPERLLTGIALRTPFTYLALNPFFKERAQREKGKTVWPCDGHWNERGHEWAADLLFDYLVSRGL